MHVLRLKGHPGVTGTLIQEQERPELMLTISDGNRVEELRMLFQRGLNTWDAAPDWLFEVSDMIDVAAGRIIPPRRRRKEDAETAVTGIVETNDEESAHTTA